MEKEDVLRRLAANAAAGRGIRLTTEQTSALLVAFQEAGRPRAKPMPNRRSSERGKVRVAGHVIYVDCGFYEDGTVGEVFLDVAKDGTMLREVLHGFAIAISLGLQWGVPVEEFVKQFEGTDFETGEGHQVLDRIFQELRALSRRPEPPPEEPPADLGPHPAPVEPTPPQDQEAAHAGT